MDHAVPVRDLLTVLDLVGIYVFALSGALVAVRKELDIVGVLVLGAVTGLGGGVVRDVLIGAVPPVALDDWRYIAMPFLAGLLAFWFHPTLGRMERYVNVADAVGLGMFAVAGALKAADYGLGVLPSVVLGAITAVGGGMIRDLLAGRVPVILRRGELYAIPAVAGATVAVIGVETGLPTTPVVLVGALLCTAWRLLAVRKGWTAPVALRGDAST